MPLNRGICGPSSSGAQDDTRDVEGSFKSFWPSVGVASRLLDHFLSWRNAVGTKRGRMMWRFSFTLGILHSYQFCLVSAEIFRLGQ